MGVESKAVGFGFFLQRSVSEDDNWVGVCPIAAFTGRRIVLSDSSPLGGHVKSLLDPTFKYVPSVETDIRKTFARVRREARQGTPAIPLPHDHAGKIALLFGDKKRAS